MVDQLRMFECSWNASIAHLSSRWIVRTIFLRVVLGLLPRAETIRLSNDSILLIRSWMKCGSENNFTTRSDSIHCRSLGLRVIHALTYCSAWCSMVLVMYVCNAHVYERTVLMWIPLATGRYTTTCFFSWNRGNIGMFGHRALGAS